MIGNNPCPYCGKERGPVAGDYPENYFCHCDADRKSMFIDNAPLFSDKHITSDHDLLVQILGALEKIVRILEDK